MFSSLQIIHKEKLLRQILRYITNGSKKKIETNPLHISWSVCSEFLVRLTSVTSHVLVCVCLSPLWVLLSVIYSLGVCGAASQEKLQARDCIEVRSHWFSPVWSPIRNQLPSMKTTVGALFIGNSNADGMFQRVYCSTLNVVKVNYQKRRNMCKVQSKSDSNNWGWHWSLCIF